MYICTDCWQHKWRLLLLLLAFSPGTLLLLLLL
jgi:hypothetical protein